MLLLSMLIAGWDIPPWKWPLHSDLHGGARTTNRAIFGGCASPQGHVLGFMSQQLHVYTYFWFSAESDYQRLKHWLRHYIDVIGALPGKIHMYVPETTTNLTHRSMRLLRATGVDVRMVATDDRRHPISWINDDLRTLPLGSWTMVPDADEFYHFPCAESGSSSMASLVTRGYDQFCGFMEDMATESGRLDPIDEARAFDLESMPYPACCARRPALIGSSRRRDVAAPP